MDGDLSHFLLIWACYYFVGVQNLSGKDFMVLEAAEYLTQSPFLIQSLPGTHVSHICGSSKGVLIDRLRELEHDQPLVPFPLTARIAKPHE